MQPALAKKRIWGRVSTHMDAIYFHATKQQEHDEYNKALGNGQAVKPKPDILKQRICFKCGKGFPPTKEICPACNIPLNRETLLDEYHLRQDLINSMGKEKLFEVLDEWWEKKQQSQGRR